MCESNIESLSGTYAGGESERTGRGELGVKFFQILAHVVCLLELFLI